MNELLSWVNGLYELKLGLSEWKWMKQIYWWKHGCATLWDQSEDRWLFGSSSMTASFWNCQWNIILRRFLRRNHQLDIVGYFIAEELPIQIWDVSQKFSEKKTYLDIVSQKQISNNLCTSFAVAKWRGPFGKFQLEAPRAYKCKQILGLCHMSISFCMTVP